MIQYDLLDFLEAIHLKKSKESKEYMLCHYWYFKDIGHKYEPYVCNSCHDLSMMVCNLDVYYLDDFMILNIKGVDYK